MDADFLGDPGEKGEDEETVLQRGAMAEDLWNAPFFQHTLHHLAIECMQILVQTDEHHTKEREVLYYKIKALKDVQEQVRDWIGRAQRLLELKKREAEDQDDAYN